MMLAQRARMATTVTSETMCRGSYGTSKSATTTKKKVHSQMAATRSATGGPAAGGHGMKGVLMDVGPGGGGELWGSLGLFFLDIWMGVG